MGGCPYGINIVIVLYDLFDKAGHIQKVRKDETLKLEMLSDPRCSIYQNGEWCVTPLGTYTGVPETLWKSKKSVSQE